MKYLLFYLPSENLQKQNSGVCVINDDSYFIKYKFTKFNIHFLLNSIVAKSMLLTAIAIAALIAISSFSQTNAQCCLASFRILHVCKGIPNELPLVIRNQWGAIGGSEYWAQQNKDGQPREEQAKKCQSEFCADGSHADGWYCCVGECW